MTTSRSWQARLKNTSEPFIPYLNSKSWNNNRKMKINCNSDNLFLGFPLGYYKSCNKSPDKHKLLFLIVMYVQAPPKFCFSTTETTRSLQKQCSAK